MEGADVAGLLVLAGAVAVLPTGRRVTVVRLDEDGLDTTVVRLLEPLLKRIAWPGRMV
ncbi:hypothetical protein D3C72_2348060 [compost metagenome]